MTQKQNPLGPQPACVLCTSPLSLINMSRNDGRLWTRKERAVHASSVVDDSQVVDERCSECLVKRLIICPCSHRHPSNTPLNPTPNAPPTQPHTLVRIHCGARLHQLIQSLQQLSPPLSQGGMCSEVWKLHTVCIINPTALYLVFIHKVLSAKTVAALDRLPHSHTK